MTTASAYAFGKIILFGEHAVLYGYPSIVSAVDRKIVATVKETKDAKDVVDAPDVKNTDFVETTIQLFKKKYGIYEHVTASTASDFSDKDGLGSSSASCVAVCKALNEYFKTNLSNREVFSLCMEVVQKVQNAGSGVDLAAAIYGGTLWYGKKEDPKDTVVEKISCNVSSIYIAHSGLKASTSAYIEKVKNLKKENPEFVEDIFMKISEVTLKAKNAMQQGNVPFIGELMNQNNALLQKLDVSTPQLDAMVQVVISAGAYGAKLSGAGGGDNIVFVSQLENIESIQKELQKIGATLLPVRCHTE